MPNPERLPEKAPKSRTIRNSPVELDALIAIQEELLASEPDIRLSVGS